MSLKPFFSALRFLTILPIPERWCGDEVSFHKSPNWYPLVGLLIGLLMVVVDLCLRWLLPVPAASVLLLLAMIGISGALHLDGLADSADAFFSSRGPERMLEIMKDSRSGPMGVTAITLVLLFKFALLLALPLTWRWQVVLLMPVAGRCALPVLSSWLPYARSSGTAAFTNSRFSLLRSGVALVVMLISSFALLYHNTILVRFQFQHVPNMQQQNYNPYPSLQWLASMLQNFGQIHHIPQVWKCQVYPNLQHL